MGVTVCANGLSVVHQGSGGEANATLPDVCLTTVGKPVVPIPYGNNAKSADLADGTTTVSMDGGNSIAIKGSKFSKSTGDAGGDKKGVASGTIESEAEFISASPTVSIEGIGVCRLSDQMTMNKANTMCLGGVQNPSVSVTEDQEGTYTLDLVCRYPNGQPYANAPFELRESGGGQIGSGVLNARGLGTVSELPLKECILVLKESSDAYKANSTLSKNTPTETYPDTHNFCTYVAGQRSPFWEDKVGVSNDWGVLLSPSYSDDDFKAMVYEQSRILSPHVVSRNHSNDFSAAFVSALFHIQEDRESLDKYQPLLELLFEQVHPNGDILRILYQANLLEPPAELLAKLRLLGTGNTIEYLQQVLWTQISQQLSGYINDLIAALDTRLDFIQTQAAARSLTVVEEGVQGYRTGMSLMSSALPDILTNILSRTNETLLSVSAMASGSIVNTTGESGFTTNAGKIHAVVYTKAINLNRPQFIVFEDIFSD